MTGSVEDERERAGRWGGNPNKRDNVWVGELTARRNISAISLGQNVNSTSHEEPRLPLTRNMDSKSPFS